MSNIDYTRLVTAEEHRDLAAAAHHAAVKTECSRRIRSVLDAHTVANLQGAAIAGILETEEMTQLRAGQAWIVDMLHASRMLAQDPEADFTADVSWPPLPEAVVALAAAY